MTLDMDTASALRHDLITPINHILGYCQILIEDANENRKVYRSQSIRSIQERGRLALDAIDDAISVSAEGSRSVDMQRMGRDLLVPCSAIVETCKAIGEASGGGQDDVLFFEDLTRIREAAAQLIELAGLMNDSRGPIR